MASKEVLIGLLIHFVTPLIGFLTFLRLTRRITKQNVPDPPIPQFFIIFATYGGLLITVLTVLFWQWSGMASIGMLYLIFIAPLLMGGIAFGLRNEKNVSSYHLKAYELGVSYFAVAPMTLVVLLVIDFLI